MTRVKRGTTSMKHRRRVLKQTRGFRGGRKSKERQANEALAHAGAHAFAHRKDKKGDFRALWQTRISAALAKHKLSYSKFISALKKNNIGLNRKILSELAAKHPAAFDTIVEKVK